MKPQPGDIIRYPRNIYSHYAIYVGDGEIIHRADAGFRLEAWAPAISSPSGVVSDKTIIRRDPLLNPISGDYGYEIDNMHDSKYSPLSPHEIVQRAEDLLGKLGYNIFFKNCEHFATWCRYDKHIRSQEITRTLQKVGDITVEAGKNVVVGVAKTAATGAALGLYVGAKVIASGLAVQTQMAIGAGAVELAAGSIVPFVFSGSQVSVLWCGFKLASVSVSAFAAAGPVGIAAGVAIGLGFGFSRLRGGF